MSYARVRVKKRDGVWMCEVSGIIMAYIADAEFSIGEAIECFRQNAFLQYPTTTNVALIRKHP